MALKAHKAFLMPRQHAGIGRTVRLMACGTAFELDRRMFERKGSALVTVAFEAAHLVPVNGLQLLEPRTTVGIVAVHARHRAFGHGVMMRPLELGGDT